MKGTEDIKAAVGTGGRSGTVSVEVAALSVAKVVLKYFLSSKWRLRESR